MDLGRADELCPPPLPDPTGPSTYTIPPGAVDTHAHVVGTEFVANRSYTPPPASAERYLAMLDATGMTYGVLVQISVHGTDNRVMLDAVAAHRDRLRAVAVTSPDVSDRELADLAAAGVVGLRLNTTSGGGYGFDAIDRYEAICREMGWHLQLFTDTRRLQQIAGRIGRASVPVVVDHLGDADVTRGTDAPDFATLVALLRDGAWTKLSGAFRLAENPADTIPFARALVEAAPGRCVWGSDWPHVGFWGAMPRIGDLLDLLGDWVPDPGVRADVFTRNAHTLYGFDTPKEER